MKMKNSIIIKGAFVICLLINSGLSYAISNSQGTKKIKYNVLLTKADIAYQNSKFAIAAEYYDTYLQASPNFQQEILPKLADCYWQMRKYDKSFTAYKLIYTSVNLSGNQKDKIKIAELYARNGQYKKAAEWLNGVPGYQMKAINYYSQDSINALKKDSLNWKLDYLNINTSYREFSPTIANNTLFFSSNKPLSIKAKANGWDGDNYAHLWEIPISNVDSIPSFYQLELKNSNTKTQGNKNKKLAGIYDCGDNKSMDKTYRKLIKESSVKADLKPVGNLIKGLDKFKFNAGAISVDKYNHIYFSANYPKADKKGVNRICLMEGLYSSTGISKIRKLPFGDASSYSVMHPAVNSFGTILVCSSDKNGGKGNFDLYYSQRSDINQPWDSLKPLGENINTVGNEVFPSISVNGFLYFSSDNIPGLGGLDIFKIPLKDAISGKGKAEHISYPINSSADDFSWTEQDTTGLKGCFTSDRLNYNDNIYCFTYVPNKIPKLPKKSFIDGYVFEKQSLKPIPGATVFLYNITEDTVYIAKADQNGKYHFPVLTTSKVIIKAVDIKYLSDCLSSNIVYEAQPKDTIQNAPRNLLLDKFKVGFVWKLSNIHYDFDKWNIRLDAMPILDSLIMVLNEQPITVELGSHTDSRGSSKYNKKLSQHRAESAVAYLIQHGINSKRISAKGYGESQLLNRCSDGVPCSDEEHQANRRTEVKVTGYTTPQKVSENINLDKFKAGQIINKSVLPNDFFVSCK
jgi:outer membrane protein OmpA-like peptidoglycan-associated protein